MSMGWTRGRARGRGPTGPTGATGAAALLPALLLVLVLTVTGCGQGDGTGDGTGASPVEPASPVPPPSDGPPPTVPSTAPDTGTDTPTEDGMVPEDLGSTAPLDPPARPGGADMPADPVGSELVLTVGGAGAAGQSPVTLTCDFAAGTATGTHPRAQQACTDLLAAVGAGNPFAPVPRDAMCTQQFGGDAVVEVSGAVLAADGAPVDVRARFSLTDGCEISRWEQMGAVLAPYRGSV